LPVIGRASPFVIFIVLDSISAHTVNLTVYM
jgi:hypothetical protein